MRILATICRKFSIGNNVNVLLHRVVPTSTGEDGEPQRRGARGGRGGNAVLGRDLQKVHYSILHMAGGLPKHRQRLSGFWKDAHLLHGSYLPTTRLPLRYSHPFAIAAIPGSWAIAIPPAQSYARKRAALMFGDFEGNMWHVQRRHASRCVNDGYSSVLPRENV